MVAETEPVGMVGMDLQSPSYQVFHPECYRSNPSRLEGTGMVVVGRAEVERAEGGLALVLVALGAAAASVLG